MGFIANFSKQISSIILVGLFSSTLYANISVNNSYVFDMGANQTELSEKTILASQECLYSVEEGYGWIVPPENVFHRKELYKSRNELDIDGVTGQKLSFKIDAAKSKWYITILMEAGLEDSSTAVIRLNGEMQSMNWQSFSPPAEGRKTLQKIYRVFHGPVQSDSDGILIDLEGKADSIRVLGVKLYPDPVPRTDEQHSLLSKIRDIGKFTYAVPLDSLESGITPLLHDLDLMLEMNSDDSFARYWYDQLSILQKAEHYIRLMGWEWAKKQTGMGIFDRYHGAVMLLDGLLDRPVVNENPLYERALWQRGRVLYWLVRERHGRNEEISAKRDLSELYKLYPHHDLLAMYNGKKIEYNDDCTQFADLNAPAWSISQFESMCHLRHIIHWWVTERQSQTGEFGGKLDDDVELLRAFPALVLSGDSLSYQGWKKLADGVWSSDWLYKGYSKAAIDVEHASELIADSAPEMVLYTDDEEYIQRLHWSVKHFRDLWTGLTSSGSRYFKSSWFGSKAIRTDPPRDRDVEMNARAVKAIRYFAWKTGDEEAIQLLHEWSSAWVKAAMRTDKGKPAGIIPASIRFADESFNGDEPSWYCANMYWNYYDWHHNAGSMLLDQMLFTYTLTGDSNLLKPLETALELIQECISEGLTLTHIKGGSREWAVRIMLRDRGFWNVVEQWRFITHDNRFDPLLLKNGTPYVKFRLTGDERYLDDGFENNLSYNRPLLTSEVLHTDRVYLPGGSSHLGTFHLNAMLTGSSVKSSPYHAVSWEKTNTGFTALVTDTGREKLVLQLYSHDSTDHEISMRVWQLVPGSYQLTVNLNRPQKKLIKIIERGQRIPISLPPRKLLSVRIDKD